MTISDVLENYFSEKTLSHLKPQTRSGDGALICWATDKQEDVEVTAKLLIKSNKSRGETMPFSGFLGTWCQARCYK